MAERITFTIRKWLSGGEWSGKISKMQPASRVAVPDHIMNDLLAIMVHDSFHLFLKPMVKKQFMQANSLNISERT